MKILEKIKSTFYPKEKRSRGYFDEENTYWRLYGNSANVSASTPTLAMKLATVYRCVDIFSSAIASLPLEYSVNNKGVYQVLKNSDLSYILNVQANARQTAYELMKNAIIQRVLLGNAYIYPRYYNGEIYSLILLSPHSTTYDVQRNKYIVNDYINGVYGDFGADEIIHLRNTSLDGGYVGVSTIQYASRCLDITANADERTLDSFKPGNTMKGFISGDGSAGVKGFGELQDNQLESIADRVANEINSGKNIFNIPGQAKFNQISISPTDLQLLDTKKFGVLEICRFFGVHPDKVFAGQSTNYKASEMSNVSFLSDTLRTSLVEIETALNAKLLGRYLYGKAQIKFNIEAMFETDLDTMANYIEKTVQNGVFTPNYWRAKKNQPPIDGGEQLFISCNVAPISSKKIKGEK